MEKINFVNNSQPALNATNLNKLQDNIEEELDNIIPKLVYSTTETVAGTWINNKPIYRKVIQVNNLTPDSASIKTIPHGINNFDRLISIKCIVKDADRFYDFVNYTFIDQTTGQNQITATFNVNYENIYLDYYGNGYLEYMDNVYIILEYTKTTD